MRLATVVLPEPVPPQMPMIMVSRQLSVDDCEFKLEVQQNVVCGFAPAGRDVYSLAVLSLLQSSVGAQPLLLASAQSSRFRVSLLTERDLRACAPGYKHLAPLERNEFHSCTF